MASIRRLVKVVPLAVLLGIAALLYSRSANAAPPCTVNWTGSAGDSFWQNADNWNPVRIPNSTDFACIPSANTEQINFTGTSSIHGVKALGSKLIVNGNLTLTDTSQPSTIRNLRAALNKLSVAPGVNLTLSGHPVFAGGSLGGGGTATVPAGSNLAFVAHAAIRDGTTVNLKGPTSWTTGNICIGEGTVINNESTFTISATSYGSTNVGVLGDCNVAPTPDNRFNNLAGGTVNRTGAAGPAAGISVAFNNSGALQTGPGSLVLGPSRAGTSDSGSFAIGGGATLLLTGARQFDAALTVSGDGVLNVHADVVFAGQSVPHAAFSGGTVTGPVTVAADGSWSAGRFDGNADTTIAPAADFVIAGDVSLHNGRTLTNNGTIHWNGGT